MSGLIDNRINSPQPDDYVTPSWPSLYWPFPLEGQQSYFLYQTKDVWRFTLYWTLLFFGAIHMVAAGYAVLIQWRNWKVIWITPIVYGLIGGVEGFLSGSVVGGLLGAIYNAGYLRISTWVPFVWALVCSLVAILSSFSIQGGL